VLVENCKILTLEKMVDEIFSPKLNAVTKQIDYIMEFIKT